MAEQWFYSSGGKKLGPVSFLHLKELAISGQLKSTDVVQREGTMNWVPALSVDGLIAIAESQSPATSQGKPVQPPVFGQQELLDKATVLFEQSVSRAKEMNIGLKDPILVAVASLLLPPLGQLLIGQSVKAIAMFFLFPVLLTVFVIINEAILPVVPGFILLVPTYCLAMAADAFLNAKKLKDGKSLGNWEFFAQWSPY